MPALLAVLPIYLLGVAMAWCLGVRGRVLPLITSVPLLIGGAALVGEAFALVGRPTSPLRVIACLALSAAAVAAVRLLVVRRRAGREDQPERPESLDDRWAAIGGAAGVLAGLAAWLPGVVDANRPPQGSDDIFHGFLVARLAEADDLGAAAMVPDFVASGVPTSFYPYGTHLLMALARSLTGAAVPQVMNGTWGASSRCAVAPVHSGGDQAAVQELPARGRVGGHARRGARCALPAQRGHVLCHVPRPDPRRSRSGAPADDPSA